MVPADLVGFIAAALSASIALPQLVRVLRGQPMGDTPSGCGSFCLGMPWRGWCGRFSSANTWPPFPLSLTARSL